ncbi:hypothetical protein [Streptomyces sp. NPDC050528]|uniref:hypothetical protein n=1 Tax=Streptomyces sp. NPDC050528 TaxID=3365623 RepID=UPI0037AD2C21
MRWLGSVRCPVGTAEEAWVEDNMAWLADQFEPEVRAERMVEPTAEFFPGAYAGSDEDIRRTVQRVCKRMRVDYGRLLVEVEPYDDTERQTWLKMGLQYRSGGAVGHYRREGGRPVVAISQHLTRQPMALVATIAHELGHVLLLDEGRITTAQRPDHEQLTDLLTVHFGLGIFSANASFDFTRDSSGWSRSQLGYLSEEIYGYALAVYAAARGEQQPPEWARYLDTNPRVYMKQGLRYLSRKTRQVRS